MNQVNPQIVRHQDQTHIYFAPKKLWDFVHVEHFELVCKQHVSMNQLRHTYTHIEEVVLRIDLNDLERLLQKRLSMSSFTEIHLDTHDNLLICWGLHQPTGKRPSPFYLEGIFHPSPQGIRFELYRGYVLGNSTLNATLLSAEIFREAKLPISPQHPSVLHFDPLTELSLAMCLDWGWKLPQRKYVAQVNIEDQSIYYQVHQGQKAVFKTNPAYQDHLQSLQRFFEGEQLMHKGEWQSALQFYQNHLDHVKGRYRYFELALSHSKYRRIAEEWLKQPNTLDVIYHDFAQALYYEQGGNRQDAAESWHTWIQALSHVDHVGDEYAYDLNTLKGLVEYSRALLLESINPRQSLHAFEKARLLLPKSLSILFNASQVALSIGDEALAQARLSEQAQRLSQAGRTQEAAWAWVQLGELWRCSHRTFDSAERAFKRALEQSSHLIAAYQGLAAIAEDKGERTQACHYLDLALQQAGTNDHQRSALLEMKQRIEKLSMPIVAIPAIVQNNVSSIKHEAFHAIPAHPPSSHEKPTDLNIRFDSSKEAAPSVNSSPTPLPNHQDLSTPQLDWKSNDQLSSPFHQALNKHELATHIPKGVNHQITRKPEQLLNESIEVRVTKPAQEVKNEQGIDEIEASLNQASHIFFDNLELLDVAESPSQFDTDVRVTSEKISKHFDPITTNYKKMPQRNHNTTAESLALDPILEASRQTASYEVDIESAELKNHTLLPPPDHGTSKIPRMRERYSQSSRHNDLSSNQVKRQPYTSQPIIKNEQSTYDLSLEISLSDMFPSISEASQEQEVDHSEFALPFEHKQKTLSKIKLLRQQLNRASIEAHADILFEIASIYRDELLDLERAQDAFWDYLYSASVQHPCVPEALESLYDIYLSQHHWNGILEIYDFKIEKELGNRNELLLLKAATLKEMGNIQAAIELSDQCVLYEEALRFKVDLLSQIGRVEEAIESLSENLSHLDKEQAFARQCLAARLLREEQPAQSAQLYEVLYERYPSEELFNEWMEHVQGWGDPYGKAVVVRAFGKQLGRDADAQKKRCKSLTQLAHEVSQTTPLLSIELFQEALAVSQDDVALAESLLHIALKYDQYIAIGSALIYLIPLCLPGEYRGILKLRLTLNQMILTSQPMEDLWDDTFKDLKNPIEDIEGMQEIITWSKSRCSHRWNVVRAKLQRLDLGSNFKW